MTYSKIGTVLVGGAVFFSLTVGCTSTPSAENRLQADTSTASETETFLTGLHAPLGSAERKAAGQVFQKAMEPHLLKMERNLSTVETKRLKNVVQWTLDYLGSDQGCAPDERVTLYRGFGRQPIFGPKGEVGKGFMVNNHFMSGMIGEVFDLRDAGKISFTSRDVQWQTGQSEPTISGDFLGDVIYRERSQLQSFNPVTQPWEEYFMDYKFGNIASVHTVGEDYTVLISTSTSPSVAHHFGPGILTLSVCPERAMMVDYFAEDYTEFEVYVPFFLLPEEIVSVSGQRCGEIKDSDLAKECYGPTFTPPVVADTAASRIYHSCLMNFGTDAEASSSDFLRDRFVAGPHRAFYDLVTNSSTAENFRSSLATLAPICKPDCALAAKVEEVAKERLDGTDEGVDPQGFAEAKRNLEEIQRVLTTSCQGQ